MRSVWQQQPRWLVVVVLCLSVVACSNSKLVLRPLYNSLDNRFEDPILEHANFSDNQLSQINDLIDHYHVWHRQTQLDAYAQLLDDVVTHQREDNTATESDIARWSQAISDYRENLLICSPFYLAAPIIAGLSDEQVSEVKQHRLESRKKRSEARAKRNAERDDEFDFEAAENASVDERIKQIKRYVGFAGLDLNQDQLADLKKTMGSTMRPDTPFGAMLEKWDLELEAIIDQRTSPDWDAVWVDFFDRRRAAMSARRDKVRDHNRGVWEAYALRTFQSLDSEQRQATASYLSALSATAKSLAADQPSYTKQSSADYQCRGRRIN